MTGSAVLTLIVVVASTAGDRATVQGEPVGNLRPADVGRVQYQAGVDGEPKTIEVGTAEVVSVQDGTAVVRLTSDREVRPGFEVRFELPLERILAQGELGAALPVEAPREAPRRRLTPRPPLLPTSVQLEARVRAWAEAWSSQDVGAYLASYAAAYEPPGTSRQEWEIQRTRRLLDPEFIEITIGSFELLSATPQRAEVRFEQSYRSDTFQDRVTKTLELVAEANDWRIAQERAQ